MRAGLFAVVVAAAAAAISALAFGSPPAWLRSLAIFLGAWTAVSLVATAFIVSWFRATARANEALTQTARKADWKGELAIR